MSTTALTIINSALRKNGVDEPNAIEQSNALACLNDMLSYLSIDGLLIPYIIKESFALSTGVTMPRTIGSGGNFDTAKPIKIIDAYLRDSSSTDSPLDVNMSEQEYNNIVNKTTTGTPTRLWYLTSYPLGNIYMDYVPNTAYTLILDSMKQLEEFTLLSTAFNFPNEYRLLLTFNLAVMLSSEYGSSLADEVIAIAEQSKMAIRANNIKVMPIAIPSGLRWNQSMGGNILLGG